MMNFKAGDEVVVDYTNRGTATVTSSWTGRVEAVYASKNQVRVILGHSRYTFSLVDGSQIGSRGGYFQAVKVLRLPGT